jgi:hypothetical protein
MLRCARPLEVVVGGLFDRDGVLRGDLAQELLDTLGERGAREQGIHSDARALRQLGQAARERDLRSFRNTDINAAAIRARLSAHKAPPGAAVHL